MVIDKFLYNTMDSIVYENTKSEVYANQNKERAYICGVSSLLKFYPIKEITLSIYLNYTYGRVLTDSITQPLGHIPPFMTRYQLSYCKNRFTSYFFIIANGEKKISAYRLNGEDNENYATAIGMPAWITLNLRLNYTLFKSTALTIGMENLLDTQYRTFASGINAPGRSIFGSLRVNF